MVRRIGSLVALVVLLGCEQENQPLPFDVTMPGTRTISAQGGTISTPSGAAVHFPSGSLGGNVSLTLGETAVPAGAEALGSPASPAFAIEPIGTVLSKPAALELKFNPSVDANRSWLASVVGVANGIATTYPSSRVDLGTGIVSTDIDRLGTYLVVIPSSSSVFPVQRSVSAALLPDRSVEAFLGVMADSISVECGDASDPCAGLTVTATQNLLDLVEDAALVYPEIEGVLRIGLTEVTGSIAAHTSIRLLLESGQTAETVEVNAVLSPTSATTVSESGSEIRLTAVRHTISGSTGSSSGDVQETTTLVIPRNGGAGSVTIERTFEIETGSGSEEPATVTIRFPVTIHS